MTYDNIKYQVADEVATITFNRPEVNNGFNIPMCQEIMDALKQAEQDTAVKIVVFDAEGDVFSVGGDLAEMQRAVDANDLGSLVDIAHLVQDISFAIKQLPKPVIFAVDGPVAGAAFNLALAADFCVASDRTKFIQAFVNVGLAPDAGGLFLLTRAVGLNKATHLVMTGEPVPAEKALEYGFVYKVAAPEKLEKTVKQVIKRLKRGSFNSYAAMKQLVWKSLFTNWPDYASLELELQESLSLRDDFTEGVNAFTERRVPKFTGK